MGTNTGRTTSEQMFIGELVARAGVNAETVRFYERKGLLPVPARLPSGYRIYRQESLERLRFIKHAQKLGFSLRQVGELLALRVTPDGTCGDVKQRTVAHLREVADKLQALSEIQRALSRLVQLCDEERLVGECPILTALETSQASSEEPNRAG